MRKVLLSLILLVLILSLTGCPGFFGDPLTIDDQWVNEGMTLSFDLKDYTTARDVDNVVYELLDENPPWVIDGSIFTFSDVDFEGSPYSVSVSATNEKGDTVTDTFLVFVNRYPYQPEDESPEDGALGVSVDPILEWNCEDADITEGAYDDFLVFDIVVWVDNPETGTIIAEHSGFADNRLQLYDLEEGTIYYWRVTATDSNEASTAGVIWSFRTEAQGPQLEMLKPVGKGTVDPEQGVHTYQEGEGVELVANPASGWLFEKWELDADFFSDESETQILMDSDKTVQAFFVAKNYVIAAAVQPEGSGLINGLAEFEGVFSHGQLVELDAQSAEGFRFVEWTGDIDGIDETESSLAFEADGERELTANFELKRYTVTVSADPEEAGIVTGGGIYNHGDTVNLAAEELDGWLFVEWQINGMKFEQEQVQFIVERDTNATAYFRVDSRPLLSIMSTPLNGIELRIDGVSYVTPFEKRVSEGSTVQIDVERYQELDMYDHPVARELRGIDARFDFVKWDDDVVSNSRSVVVQEDTYLTAIFDAEYRVESKSSPEVEDPGNDGWHNASSVLKFEVPLETTVLVEGEEITVPFDKWRINREYYLDGKTSGGKATLELEITAPTFVQALYNVPCNIRSSDLLMMLLSECSEYHLPWPIWHRK